VVAEIRLALTSAYTFPVLLEDLSEADVKRLLPRAVRDPENYVIHMAKYQFTGLTSLRNAPWIWPKDMYELKMRRDAEGAASQTVPEINSGCCSIS
jgi:hypothetical protein